ncbi:MAG: hypothetical protein Q7K25_10895 [Actinomycetota bacterium]|nr:hypothetical protein [Actinomycetota bacterium]
MITAKSSPRLLVACVVIATALLAVPAVDAAPTGARIVSAAWGLNNGNKCPSGETGLDNIPVTFNWFIRTSTIAVDDFVITRDDGTTVHPTCALQYPPDEANELQTVNLIGDFGDPAAARPITVTVVGGLDGHPPKGNSWRPISPGLTQSIVQIEAGPDIADVWMLNPRLLAGDKNACTIGGSFVRVAWSNGMTAYPEGTEIGDAVVQSYRALFTLPNGKVINVRPLAVADLADHSTTAMDDNMHDLCLSRLPVGAVLTEVRVGANFLQDPNGDPNRVQHFKVRR